MVLLATTYQLLLLVMTQENQSILLEQAKQGDAKAIASLLNQQYSKGCFKGKLFAGDAFISTIT